ncbi:MAG: YecA family protein [Pseudomonadota bacterium]|nr:YecA family protein [Pseudomonadota bacterium]
MSDPRSPRTGRGGRGRQVDKAIAAPLGDGEIGELQKLLDAVPAPLEPLDVSSLDGFLCGVIVQPAPVAPVRWLAFVTDVDGRALPAGFDARRLHALVARREAELRRAIGRREWFDPWLFELEDDGGVERGDGNSAAGADPAYPWVAGFAAALETFPGLLGADEAVLTAPLALLYRHLGADDLEDADALLAEIETLAPPADLAESVEELVRATLLLADVAGVGVAR